MLEVLRIHFMWPFFLLLKVREHLHDIERRQTFLPVVLMFDTISVYYSKEMIAHKSAGSKVFFEKFLLLEVRVKSHFECSIIICTTISFDVDISQFVHIACTVRIILKREYIKRTHFKQCQGTFPVFMKKSSYCHWMTLQDNKRIYYQIHITYHHV